MADHSKPTNTSLYTNYTSEIDARFDDITVGLDPALVTATNLPTGAIRWSSASNKWQKWSGSAWGELSTSFVFPSITSSALTSGRVTFASTAGLLADSANLTFNGTTLTSAALTTTSNVQIRATGSNTVAAGAYLYLNSGDGSGNGNIIQLNASNGLDIWNSVGGSYTKKLTLDSSGNLGLGVTPSAWGSPAKVIELGNGSAFFSYSNPSQTLLTANSTFNGTNWIYKNTAAASHYEQAYGVHKWLNAPSGTAGNTITWTQAMTLHASGGLSIGNTSDPSIHVVSLGNSSYVNSVNFNALNSSGQSSFGVQSSTPYGTIAAGDAYVYTAKHVVLASDSASGAIKFGTGAGIPERMRIDSSGSLLVGATSNSLGYGGSGSYGRFLLAGTTTAIPTTDSNNPAGTAYATMTGSGLSNTTDWLNLRGPYSNATHGSGILMQDAFYDNGGYGGRYIRAYGRNIEFGRLTNGSIGVSNGTLTQHMTLDDSGNLGIGTASPIRKLQVLGDVGVGLLGTSGSYAVTYYPDTSGNAVFWTKSDGYFAIGTGSNPYSGGTERMRLDASGDMLVGTTANLRTNPFRLQLNASSTTRALIAKVNSSGTPCAEFWVAGNSFDNILLQFTTNTGDGIERGSITYNRGGGVIAYNTTSDYRAKDIIGPVENALEDVSELKVHLGIMKGATQQRPMFIAHELQEIAPYAVTGKKDAVNQENKPIHQQLDVSILVPLLTKAIQELKSELDLVKAELNTLKGN